MWQSIFEAFTLYLWIATLISGVAVGLTYYWIEKMGPERDFLSIGEAIFIPFQTLLIEAVDVRVPSCSVIIVLGVWMSMSTLIIGFYCGNITALALVPSYVEKPIDSMEDLLKSGKKWLSREGSYNVNRFPETKPIQHIKYNLDPYKI